MRYRMVIPLAVLVIAGGILPAACGQQARSLPVVDQTPAPQVKVFALQFAAAREVGDLVESLVGESTTRVVTDERTNSLVVTSPSRKDLDMIEALLLRLDSHAESANSVTTQIVPLKTAPDAALMDVLETVAGEMRYAVDPARQVLVVRGSQQEVHRVADLLKALESVDTRQSTQVPDLQSATLRIVWLMNGLEESRAKPVPAPMESAVATLTKVGITDLKLVTQLLVNVQGSRAPFESQGIVELPEQVKISVSGRTERDGALELEVVTEQIQITAPTQRAASAGHYDTSLRAAVLLKPGQLAVLGATPCGTHDSVFVVELIP